MFLTVFVNIECNDQAASSYGGIRQINLADGKVEIILDEKTAKKLFVNQHIVISFPRNHENYPDLQKYLKQNY